jgi:hypothetical protein
MVDILTAQHTMGQHFIGPDEAHTSMRVLFSGPKYVQKIPFSESSLRQYADTHILVLVPQISIIEMRRRVDPYLFWEYDAQIKAHRSMWYDKYPFFHTAGRAEWCLLKKSVSPSTLYKMYSDQMANLAGVEYVPSVRVVAYTMLQYFLKTKERLFGRFYLQCSDRTKRGNRVAIGCFDTGGLDMDAWNDALRFGNVGLALAIKPDA